MYANGLCSFLSLSLLPLVAYLEKATARGANVLHATEFGEPALSVAIRTGRSEQEICRTVLFLRNKRASLHQVLICHRCPSHPILDLPSLTVVIYLVCSNLLSSLRCCCCCCCCLFVGGSGLVLLLPSLKRISHREHLSCCVA